MIELAGIIVFGILAQWIAWRMKIPAILPLILVGIIVGPISTLYIADGSKLLEPIWNGSKGLFPDEILFDFVSLAIAIILFEGGLTLKRSEIKNVGSVIIKLITIGTIVTFIGAAIIAKFLFDLPWSICFLFSALIIVTGPTVISPILRNISLKRDVAAVLKWEGILIDPVGALVAVLIYEFISNIGAVDGALTSHAFLNFLKIIIIGICLGFSSANALTFLMKRNFIPHYLLNVGVLSCVLIVFVASNLLAYESGLLSVVIMGMVLANKQLSNIKDLLYFKESLSVLLISILFILLSANIDISDLELIFRWDTLYLFLGVILIVRPLGVFMSSYKSNLKINEKIFISWVGPRGIVAAGIASLFGQRLMVQGIEGSEYITPLVFTIVLGTVLLNATTARLFSKISGVFLKNSDTILIVGATTLSRTLAKYYKSLGKEVMLMDNNLDNVHKAQEIGFEAFSGNIFSDELQYEDFTSVGYLLAMTPNHSVNELAIKKHRKDFGEHGYYRLMGCDEYQEKDLSKKDVLLSCLGDFAKLSNIARNFPMINEISITDHKSFQEQMKKFEDRENSLPLFLKTSESKLINIHKVTDDVLSNNEDMKIAYLGKPLDLGISK